MRNETMRNTTAQDKFENSQEETSTLVWSWHHVQRMEDVPDKPNVRYSRCSSRAWSTQSKATDKFSRPISVTRRWSAAVKASDMWFVYFCDTMYMLQWMCEIREFVYFLKFSGNINIPWFTRRLYIFPDVFREFTHSLKNKSLFFDTFRENVISSRPVNSNVSVHCSVQLQTVKWNV